MKFGIYYSYWEQEWSADCLKYVEKVARLGFDVIEIAAHHLNSYSPAHIAEVGRSARDNGIRITAGLGPSPQKNLSSADPAIRKAGRAFFEETLANLAKLDIHIIGGALHSYWPIDYSKPVDKVGDRARGLEGIASLADVAADHGVTLCLEVLNRFENHVLNTADEGVAFVREVGKPNVKVMLDTFHMNIEEDSFGKAIRTAGPLLGHFHTSLSSPSGSPTPAFYIAAGYNSTTLLAPTTGTYANLVIIGPQSTSVTRGMTLAEGGTANVGGAIYFPDGALSLTGGASLSNTVGQCLQIVATQVTLSGGTTAASTCFSSPGATTMPRLVE